MLLAGRKHLYNALVMMIHQCALIWTCKATIRISSSIELNFFWHLTTTTTSHSKIQQFVWKPSKALVPFLLQRLQSSPNWPKKSLPMYTKCNFPFEHRSNSTPIGFHYTNTVQYLFLEICNHLHLSFIQCTDFSTFFSWNFVPSPTEPTE